MAKLGMCTAPDTLVRYHHLNKYIYLQVYFVPFVVLDRCDILLISHLITEVVSRDLRSAEKMFRYITFKRDTLSCNCLGQRTSFLLQRVPPVWC